jgi:tRNA threonylcarbamoyladenosine biosynthesis protein TsaB
MKILAVDSTTEACSVALLDIGGDPCVDSGQCVELLEIAPREHSQRLLPMVDQLLSGSGCRLADLDAIAYGRGPGSFTGLRICLGLVQGLAYGANLPVIAVSSLAALAQSAFDKDLVNETDTVVASFDARMDELYWGVFAAQNGVMTAQCDEQLTAPESLLMPKEVSLSADSQLIGIGNGWQYAQRISADSYSRYDDSVFPHASAVARLAVVDWINGLSCSADQAQPTYIRDQVAWKKLSEQ